MKRKFKNISKKGLIMTLCLIGIVLVLSIILMNSFSLPDQIGTISFQSKSLNYDNKEAGSFEITKSTRWISKGKARVEVNVDTISKIENGDKDIILVLDTSFGDNLVTIKKTLLDFVEKTLSNENSKIALVTYDSSSAVRVGFTKDKELLSNRINTLTTGLGKRNYYQALVSIDSILKEYQKETKEVTTIFVTNGYSNVDIENEESYYQYLKEQYPYLNMNLVWYGESIDIEKQFGKVSDKQTITSIHNLENTLLDTVDYTKAYDTFVLKDIINTEYFDSNSITNVKTSNGIVRMEKDSLIWDLEEFHTGRSSNLVFELILKENLDNEIKMVTTSKETNISYRIENEEEIINNTDIINLPTNYQVIYEENKPNGCEVENLPSNEVRQVKEVVELSNDLKCNGYNFRGWSILTEGVETLANAVGEEAYDGNIETSYRNNNDNKLIEVDSSLIGKKVYIVGNVSTSSQYTMWSAIYFDDEVLNILSGPQYKSNTIIDEVLTILENCKYISFWSGTDTSYYIEISEIDIVEEN